MVAPATDRYLVASLEFEGVLRACLHRYARNVADVDELLQDTYAHLLAAGLTAARGNPLDPCLCADRGAQRRAVVAAPSTSGAHRAGRGSRAARTTGRAQPGRRNRQHAPGARVADGRSGALADALPPGVHAAQGVRAFAEGDRRRAAHLREHGGTAPGQGHAPVQRGARIVAAGRATLTLVRQDAPARRSAREPRSDRTRGESLAREP